MIQIIFLNLVLPHIKGYDDFSALAKEFVQSYREHMVSEYCSNVNIDIMNLIPLLKFYGAVVVFQIYSPSLTKPHLT